jgi:hypothetical protein
MSQEVDAFLAHYGVKGMQWGTRRAVKLVSRSSAGTESSLSRQVKVDAKAKTAAAKATGKGSTAPKKTSRDVIAKRMAEDPEYRAAKAKYEKAVQTRQQVAAATAFVGLIAAPYLLGMAADKLEGYSNKPVDREDFLDSMHKTIFKEFEKSAYGQQRRERGAQFINNNGHRVFGQGQDVEISKFNRYHSQPRK